DADRMVTATLPDGTSSYVYNADGLRVRKTYTPVGGQPTSTWLVQDTSYSYAQVVEEYRGEPGTLLDLVATFSFAEELLTQTSYSSDSVPKTQFVHSDGFGSVRWLTAVTSVVTDLIDYDAFGVE